MLDFATGIHNCEISLVNFNHKKILSCDLLCVWQNGKAEDAGEEEEEVLDEETKKRDQIVKGAIDGLIREYSSELNAPSQDDESSRRKKRRDKKGEVGFSSFDHFHLRFGGKLQWVCW